MTGSAGLPRIDLEQVVGGADQLPLAVCGDQAPSGNGSDTSVVFDLGEDGLDDRGSLLVGLAASWTVEFGDHRGGQRVGITGPAPSEELIDPGSGHPELLGCFQCVDLPGRDPVEERSAGLLGFGDLLQLPGTARGDERLHASECDVVDAPVAGVGGDPADAPLLPGGLRCGPDR